MKPIWRGFLLFVVLCEGSAVANQVKSSAEHPTFEELKKLRVAASRTATETQAATVTPTPCSGWEPKVREQCLQAYADYFRYEATVFKQRQSDFDFQLFSTKVILFMVVLLVLAGVTFAGLQFWYALVKLPTNQTREPAPAELTTASAEKQSKEIVRSPPTPIAGMDFASDVEVSMTGFKVKSSVLGLLLVLISMGFFFLYIRYVYPIQESTQPQVTGSSPVPQK